MINNKTFEKISCALSDANRITILQHIQKGGGCLYCAEVTEALNLTQPSVSHHMKQLVDAELLVPEKEGRNVKYTLNKKTFEAYISHLNKLKG